MTQDANSIRKYVPSRDDVVRIEMIIAPEEHAKDEGLYEWWFRDNKLLMDILTLEKELKRYLPAKCEKILDRLYNFRKLYLNLTTGEMSS